jgi:hypothetical protein
MMWRGSDRSLINRNPDAVKRESLNKTGGVYEKQKKKKN